jgi:hypothetical protein
LVPCAIPAELGFFCYETIHAKGKPSVSVPHGLLQLVEPSDLPNTIVGERCGAKYTYNSVDDWKNYSNCYSSSANPVYSGIQVLMTGFFEGKPGG